jgi:transcriptional antiterminator RfaH
MGYWAVAQLVPNRTSLALHTLAQQNFTVYAPKIRELRVIRGHKTDVFSALFPGYAFVLIKLQWHAARWCPGVVRLVMDGMQPAKVSDDVIREIRDRERNGVVELPRRVLKHGDRVRILAGPFRGHLAIYAGMAAHERVALLLEMLGRHQRVTLSQLDVGVLVS